MKKLVLLPLLLLLLPALHGCATSGVRAGNVAKTTSPTEISTAQGIIFTVPAGWALISHPESKIVAMKTDAQEKSIAKVATLEVRRLNDLPTQEELRNMPEAQKTTFLQNFVKQSDFTPPLSKTLSQDSAVREINGVACVVVRTTSKSWGDDPVCVVRVDVPVGDKHRMLAVSYLEKTKAEFEPEAEAIISSIRLSPEKQP